MADNDADPQEAARHGGTVVATDPATRDPLEPDVAYAQGPGVVARVERSQAWRSVFRHPRIETPRGRALQGFSNFFLHVYPIKVPARVLRLRYSFRLGFIATVLFAILTLTGVYLMFFYTHRSARPTATCR